MGRDTNQLAERGNFSLKMDKEISLMEPRNCSRDTRRGLISPVELSNGKSDQRFVTSPLRSSNGHSGGIS